MNKAKQFIIANSEKFSTAVDSGYDIRMTEDEILEWMQKYADSEVKNSVPSGVISKKCARKEHYRCFKGHAVCDTLECGKPKEVKECLECGASMDLIENRFWQCPNCVATRAK